MRWRRAALENCRRHRHTLSVMTASPETDGPGESMAHGDPLSPILVPPRLACFRELVGMGDQPLAIEW